MSRLLDRFIFDSDEREAADHANVDEAISNDSFDDEGAPVEPSHHETERKRGLPLVNNERGGAIGGTAPVHYSLCSNRLRRRLTAPLPPEPSSPFLTPREQAQRAAEHRAKRHGRKASK
jgi:hypothetical protein